MPIDTGIWSVWGTITQDESGGTLNQTPTGVSGQYGGVISNSTYDFTNKTLQAGIAQLPSGAAGVQMCMRAEVDSNNAVIISYTAGNLLCQHQLSGTTTDVNVQAWPAGTIGFKIIFDNAQSLLWFATTANGTTWTNRFNETLPIATTALKVSLFSGTYQTVASPGTTKWESIGLPVVVYKNLTGSATGIARTMAALDEYGQSVINKSSLEAYWRLDNAAVATDHTGLHPGVYVGSVSSATTALSSGAGSAITFNGTNAYIDVPDFSTPWATGFSIEAWIKPTSWIAGASIAGRRDWNSNNGGFALEVQSTSGTLNFFVWNGSAWAFVTTWRPLGLNQWHHVVATYQSAGGGTLTIYVNGAIEVQEGSKGTFAPVVPSGWTAFQIARNPVTGLLFEGTIDELALYSSTIVSGVIADHYRKGVKARDAYGALVEATSGLIAYWRMHETADANVFDENGNGLTLRVNPAGANAGVAGLPLDVPSRAFELDGSTSATIDSVQSFTLLDLSSSPFTFEGWIYPTTTNVEPILDYNDGSGATASGFHIWQYDAADKLYVNFVDTVGGDHLVVCPSVITPNTWHHIVVLRDVNTGRVYVNNVEVGTIDLFGVAVKTNGLIFNFGWRPGAAWYTGKLAQFAFYNVALTTTQIGQRWALLGEVALPGQMPNVTSAGKTTVSALLTTRRRLTASAAGVATAAGTIGKKVYRNVTGTSVGSSTANAQVRSKKLLGTVSSAGVAATTATPTRRRPLTAVSAGVATVSVQIARKRVLLGISAGTSVESGQPTARRSITAAAAGVSTASGQIGKAAQFKNLVGTSAGRADIGQGNAITDQFFPGLPTPTNAAESGTLYELGIMFTPKVDVSGNVMGVAFYRTQSDTQPFTISLYDYDAGWTLVARKTASSSTAGWQTINFDSPQPIVYEGDAYMVTFWSPTGQFARTPNIFLSPGLDTTNLHAYYDGEGGANNGAFEINAGGPDATFAPGSYEASSYHVDVLFSIGVAGGIIDIDAKRAITGVSAGNSTASGQISRKRALVVASAGVATGVGQSTAKRLVRVPATSVGGSTATAQVRVKRLLGVYTSVGGSTVSGVVSRAPQAKNITGSAAGTSTTAAVILRKIALAGISVGASAETGQPTAKRAIVATSAGIASTTAVATRRRPLTGTSAGVAIGVGQSTRIRPVVAVAAGVSTVSATISKGTAFKAITGSATGVAVTTATATRRRPIVATASGVSTAAAQLTRKIPLTASAAGSSTVTGLILRRRALVATSAGVATVAATPTAKRVLVGTSAGFALANGVVQKLGAVVFAAQRATGTAQEYVAEIKAGAVFGAALMAATAQKLTAGTATGTQFSAGLLSATAQKQIAVLAAGTRFQAESASATAQAQITQFRTGVTFPSALATASAQELVGTLSAGTKFNAATTTVSLSSYTASMVQGLGFQAQLMQVTTSAPTSTLRSGVVLPAQLASASTQSQSAVMRTSNGITAGVATVGAASFPAIVSSGVRITAQLMSATVQSLPMSMGATAIFLAQRMQVSADLKIVAFAIGNLWQAQIMLADAQSYTYTYTTGAVWILDTAVVNGQLRIAVIRESFGITSPGPDIIYAENVVPMIVGSDQLVPYIYNSAEPIPAIVNGEYPVPYLYAKDARVPNIVESAEV